MIEVWLCVRNDGILGTHERLEYSTVGIETGSKQDRGLGTKILCKSPLECEVQVLRPQQCTTPSHSHDYREPLCGCDKGRIVGKTKIVVRAEVQHVLVADSDLAPCGEVMARSVLNNPSALISASI